MNKENTYKDSGKTKWYYFRVIEVVSTLSKIYTLNP